MQALRSKPHRVLAVLLVVAVAVAMTFYMNRANAAITTTFAKEFGTNANGAILLRGNANLVCPASASGCTGAQGGTGSASDETLNNNGYIMENTGADSANGIFNSSSATVTLPASSTVLFAGLYWSANTAAGSSGAAAPTATDKDKVKIKLPGGTAWSTVSASKVFTSGSFTAYQGFADVTSQVAGAGNGSYAVGNIQAGTGYDRYAGWSLVIAYQNAALPMRDLRVFDGFGIVSNSSTSVDIAVDGFETPSSGTVKTEIGSVVYEGDLGKTGDALKLNGTAMSDAVNPANNFFNSTISEGGTAVGSRTPNNSNTMGLDVDQFDASGKLANNATSATLTLTTGGETFYPGVVTFATDLYAPDLSTTLTGTDTDGGSLMPGDTIDYTMVVKNNGNDASLATLLTDAVPAGTTYVPGTLKISSTARTDAAADDTAEFTGDSAQGKTTFRIGTGASASAGGSLAAGASVTVTYQVKVNDSTAGGSTVTNVAGVSYTANHNGRQITGTSNVVDLTVTKPTADLEAGLLVTPATVQRGTGSNTVNFQLTVTNKGTDREPLAVGKLTLPAGSTVPSLPAGCTQSGLTVTCQLGALASGTSATVVIAATVSDTATTSSTTTATASGSGTDPTPGNNTKTATLRVNSAPTADPVNAPNTTNGTAVTFNVLSKAADTDGDTLTASVFTQPAHGSAVANADGTITYTPTSGWAGTDTFTYQVSDGNGGTATATVTVNVDNDPPVATDDHTSTAGNTPVTFDPRANDSDANGDSLSVTAVTQPASNQGTVTFTSTSVTFTPDPAFRGLATFSYTVSDGKGGTDTAVAEVTVANRAPVAVADTATTPYRTDKLIDVLGNDTDPNNDPLTLSSVDATSAKGGAVSISGGKANYSPAVGFSGTDTFTYQISDGSGGTATGTVTVTVGNAAPTAGAVTATTPYHTDATIDVLSHASDPNAGDQLSVIGATAPAHGTVVRNADGTITYSPVTGYSGPDSFDYTISDGNGGTATGTVTLTVQNAAPVAKPVSVTAESNVPLVVPVPAGISDPNGDTLTVTVDTQPAHGKAVVNPDNTVTYTPAAGYLGTDSFHYTVSDGKGGTGGATVSLTVINSAPIARDDAAVTQTDTAVTVAVLANDTDPNGDALTVTGYTNGGHGAVTLVGGNPVYTPATGWYGTDSFTYTVEDPSHASATAVVTITVQNANPIAVADTGVAQPGTPAVIEVLANDTDPNTGQTLHVVSVTRPGKGTAVVSADGKSVTYTPDPGTSGTDTFDYVVGDDAGGTDTETVTITIAPLPVVNPENASAANGTATTVDVLANDTDPNGKPLTLVSVAQPKHGSTKIVDGKVVYTPEAGYAGPDTFTYLVRNAVGGTSTGTVSVDVANAAPTAKPDAAAVVKNKTVDIDVLANDSDPNPGQKLTVSSVSNPGHGTATIGSDGKIRYVPTTGYTGTDTFTYVVSDGNGGAATGTVQVTVTDEAPVALPDERSTPFQKPITIAVLDNDLDPNGDPLTITEVTQPANGTVTYTGKNVVFTPAQGWSGTTSFTYTITDGSATSTATVTVTVSPAPVVPDKTAKAKPASPVSVTLPRTDESGQPVTVTKLGKPAHGTVTLNSDGTVTYTPEKGFAGTDSFTYTAVDEDGNVAVGTVKVAVAASTTGSGSNGSSGTTAPKVTNDTATVKVGKSVIIKVLGNDAANLTVTKLGKPKHGTAVLNSNGTVTYAPDDSYAGGQDSFTYTVTDASGATATGTVTVTVRKAGTSSTLGASLKLPKTGTDIVSVGAVGLLTLLVGAALFLFGGRTPTWLALATARSHGPGRHRPGKHADRR